MDWQKLLVKLDPQFAIPKKWLSEWRNRRQFSSRIISGAVGLVGLTFYLTHYYFVDPGLGLSEDKWWIGYRLGGAALFFVLIVLAQLKGLKESTYSIAVILVVTPAALAQAEAMNRFEGVPYIYISVATIVAVMSLRWSPAFSLMYMASVSAIQLSIIKGREHEWSLILSAIITAHLVTWLIRRSYDVDVNYFIEHNRAIEETEKRLEAERQQKQQLQIFLPRMVYNDFEKRVRDGQDPLKATEEVISPRKKFITCLHTDIRGYTKKSKGDLRFVFEEASPNIQYCVDLIESNRGIPSTKGGDEIFAYFASNPSTSILEAMKTGFELMKASVAHGPSGPVNVPKVARFVAITSGDCLIGNIGGSHGSFNISALGETANLSHRIDELTKLTQLKDELTASGVLVAPSSFQLLQSIRDRLEWKEINLEAFNSKVRDFPEINVVYFFPNTEVNLAIINESLEQQLPDSLAA